MLSRLNQRINVGLAFPALPMIIIGFGIYIRIVQYLHNRALWADEAAVTLNILDRSYVELFLPLDNEQGAPIGFLLAERLMVQLWGRSEFALRLFPLLCGIASLFLLYALAKRLLRPSAVPIALLLAASSDRLIYYSSEVKQYSSDVAVVLALTLFLLSMRERLYRPRPVLLTAAVGSIAIWWSHPAIFVLAAVELAFILTDLFQHKRLQIPGKAAIYSAWLLSFAAFYLFSLQRLSNNDVLLTSWTGRGLPPSPLDLGWSIRALSEFFYNPVGFVGTFKAIAILAALMGCVSWYRRKPETLRLMVLPVAVTLFASYLDKYPFSGRLILFLYPFAALAIAEGFEFIRLALKPKLFAPVAIAMCIVLLAPPFVVANSYLVHPILQSEIKPLMSYLETHRQPNDSIYVFWRGNYQFRYYAPQYGLQPDDYIIGSEDLDDIDGRVFSRAEWERYRGDLERLRGNARVWVMLSHADRERKNFLTYLDRVGKRLDAQVSYKADMYLYDLR